jgi:hypothetical protein
MNGHDLEQKFKAHEIRLNSLDDAFTSALQQLAMIDMKIGNHLAGISSAKSGGKQMNWSTFFDKLKAWAMPAALGVIGLSHNPVVAPFLPQWAVPVATGIAALAHAMQTRTDKSEWNQ